MSPVRKNETPGSGFQRCYRRRGSLSLAVAGGLACARASCLPMAPAIRRIRGSSGSPPCDPLSLAGQGPIRSSSFAMPTLPRQGPSDESRQESRGGSQKFRRSTCGVEMLAGGGLSFSAVGRDTPQSARLLTLPAWQAPAGPATSGQGRKPRSGGARCVPALRGWRRSGPMATSRWGHVSPSRPRFLFPAKTLISANSISLMVCQDPISLAAIGSAFDQSWPLNPVRWGPWTGCRKALGIGAMSGPGGRPEVDGRAPKRRE
jgi:hypothetical protein